jgi:acetate---CoA ligase (ADP-forming)
MTRRRHSLAALFEPRSVAIVGASEKSTWTHMMRSCLQSYGFQGQTYAINRTGSQVFGWPGFTSCEAIGKHVDAAFICVPVDAVASVLEDMGRAGIKGAVILTAGYAETGTGGADAQDAIVARANSLGISVLGPNCLGFANIASQAAITAILPRGPLLTGGRTALLCQSGATAAEVLEFSQQQGIALSFFAATGNEAQIAIADVMDYLVADPDTSVIMVAAESIRRPEQFAAAARRALAASKPVIVLKAGSSALASHVAKAHTGALVGDDRVFSAVCQKLGIIRVHSLEDLVITAGLLVQTGPLPPGGAGVASISGGACTYISDHADVAGLSLPEFSADTVGKLRAVLPDYATTLNPLDVTGGAVRDPSILEKSLAILGEDPAIAIRICVLNLPHLEGLTTPTPAMLTAAGNGLRGGASAGVLCVQTLKPVTEVSRKLMTEHGIPAITGGLDHAVRAIACALWWSDKRRGESEASSAATPIRQSTGAVDPAKLPKSEREVLTYLAGFGVPVIPAEIATTAEEAAQIARRFGGHVVLKIASADIAHKTEVGGVRLRVSGDQDVRNAWNEITTSVRSALPHARIDGVIVSPMRDGGTELFVGVTRDAQWGMAIAIGLGGVWVEVLKDTAVRLLPVNTAEVREMLASLRGHALLQGFRGAPPADLLALADAIVAIGKAALALGPAAVALEVNPLLVCGGRVEALDGLVVAREENLQSTRMKQLP